MSSKFKPPITIALVLGILLSSCTQPGSTDLKPEKLILTGASTIAPLALSMGQRFEEQNPNIRIDVQTGGSSKGLADAKQGLADIGMVSRALKPEEQAGTQVFLIGLDGIAIVVHAENPLQNITRQQVIDIYTGKIENWQDLGGKDAPITVVHRAEGHSTLDIFLEYFGLDNTDIQPDAIIGDNQQGLKTIAGNPDAIGYLSIGSTAYDMNQGVKIKMLSLDGIEPNQETVADGSFPLHRPLNLVTEGEPSELAKKFIDFNLAEENHDIIRQQKFIPPKN
ncbi:phosphate ABC transporter substrate-binding protein [Spirulina sp. 06S082]|uniref:phosphate ABC transporter substrate-binding protein n=1 Tax=Spirulina sp. 06S082 TaxID=3110248 RepID=UPI002B2044F9|nr:phosphate ABC transporter substrate-binding protein [Spirulina sp. 06S082]MEA5472291.1 phosphate ABC transporter substrate-binding protein [Spirulina sp. 06S082]